MVSEYIPQLIKQSKNLAIFINDFTDIDKVVSVISFALMVKSEGKDVEIIAPPDSPKKFEHMFETYNLELRSQMLPQRYVVKIDYANNPIEKVTYEPDEKTGKLNFYITPKSGEFSFENIEYSKEGTGYDLLIFMGMKSPKDLGQLYLDNKELFESSKIIAYSRSSVFPADNIVELKKNNTFSEVVYYTSKQYFPENSFDPEIASLLMLGVLDKSGFLEGFISKDNQKLIGTLASLGGNLNKALKQVYFSKDNANTLLQLKVGEKVKFDFKNGVSYALLNQDDLEYAGIKSEAEIDVKGRLVNNISRNIDFACIAYEVAPEKLWVIIQADGEKFSAVKFAQVFEGKGNEKCASCVLKNTGPDQFETVLYSILKDLYRVVALGNDSRKKTSDVQNNKDLAVDKEETLDYPY